MNHPRGVHHARHATAPPPLAGLLGVACLPSTGIAQAPGWPDRPVRLIVPFPPGGGTDALARILAPGLSRIWGQPLVVDNRAGAQGNIGTQLAVKSPPDGYTLVFAHQGVLTVNAHLYAQIGFDPLKDMAPVTLATVQPFLLVAHPSVPAQNLAELTALAKREPGKLTFASSASGPQMAGELYKSSTGISMLHVAYKGAGPAVVDVLAGTVNLMVANPTSVAPHVKSGKLRGIVVFGNERVDILPDVPTAAEAGYPDLGRNPEWYGIGVPAGTPPAVVQKLQHDIATVLDSDEAQKAIRGLGLIPTSSTPEAFARRIRVDYEVWGRVVKISGAKPEGS
ncbi:tripartite tricarboxylate transporter substrate binding protein [Xylophilus sp. GOD-11R]|uniref:Bug family tripartite tricarboxylate transporter substrate binding protein n=1 Tax=Xylophilus sp. GOD-11R TaxID=3089814 RepID=UPI00298BEF6F|nr:tripartite tricarboxylate transporter substrate binding protein [Xylophilus sp. GOD-11R]WPB55502.1 tripartite tricarboxylate transporter substrate binding protein [Xylophilus sp. GOD-11R]